MYKVVEMPTGEVLAETSSFEDAAAYIESIESKAEYQSLMDTYGSLRRVQQELTISSS